MCEKVFVIVVIEESTIDLGHICILDYYKDNPKEAIVRITLKKPYALCLSLLRVHLPLQSHLQMQR
jgi:hypothetical protein